MTSHAAASLLYHWDTAHPLCVCMCGVCACVHVHVCVCGVCVHACVYIHPGRFILIQFNNISSMTLERELIFSGQMPPFRLRHIMPSQF